MDRTGSDFEMIQLVPPECDSDFGGAVKAAVNLFKKTDGTDVSAIYIVGGHRPTDCELSYLRRQAKAVAITVDDYGCVSMRRRPGFDMDYTVQSMFSIRRQSEAALSRIRRHAEAWNAGFTGLNEGVR